MRRAPVIVTVCATLFVLAAVTSPKVARTQAPAAAGDAVAGKAAFVRCSSCHSMTPGRMMMGPSLAGVMGRRAGSLPGYRYSPAMAKANVTWSKASLSAFLAAPGKLIPGSRMPASVPDKTTRDNIVAYLASLSARK